VKNCIHQLDSAEAAERGQIGGKGVGLARMVAAGVPVPPGFVVTTEAYLEFLAANGLAKDIESIMANVDYENAEQLTVATEKIRRRFLDVELPASVREQIEGAYLRLDGKGETHVAVRSSGTAEDMGDASFAGLYDSFLDIRSAGDVVTAVRRCWASLWTARCAYYRNRLGLDSRQAHVAVVVQRMVAAESAGVLFTANPLNGRTDEMVVNANYGLGESIASGIVTPDELVLDAKTLAVKRKTLGGKTLRIDRARNGAGTIKTDTAAADRERFSLSDQDAAKLAAVAKRVLAMARGIPQDIEWTMAGGEFFIVQSRDVTGIEFLWEEDIESWQNAPDSEDTVWSHTWTKAFWTGGVTPLFYSLRGRELRNSDVRLFTLWGFDDLANMRRFKYRRSTVYFSSDADRLYYRYMMPVRLRRYTLDNLPPDWREDARLHPWSLWKWLRTHLRIRFLSPDHGPFRSSKNVYNFVKAKTPEANRPSAEELRNLSDGALRQELTDKAKLFEDYLTILRPAFHVYSATAFAMLKEMLRTWYDGPNEYAFQDLISGLPRRTAMLREQVDLWELAAAIRKSPALTGHLAASRDGAFFFADLPKVEGGAAFKAKYDAFLEEHGHRGHQDRDIWYPRRSEDPQIDFQSFRSMVASTAASPVENEHRLVHAREAATNEVLANIRRKRFGGIKAQIFSAVLTYVHDFLVLRDDERPFADAVTMGKKRAAVELGRRLYERKLIAQPDDYFFLAEYEIHDLIDGKASQPLVDAKIRNRRKVFEQFLARTEVPPDYLKGNSPMEVDDATATGQEGVFQGAAMSRGAVTGTARIVRDLREIGRLQKGEILVCNSTDPGWTPAFGLLSGLILEAGGILSHGACLSREYGLPAVTLPNAIQKIPDGATITLDGSTGRVTIVKEAYADAA
jgi:pyruvate,water dikinase